VFYWRIFVSLLCLSLGSCPKAQGLDEGFYLGMDAFAAENYEVAAELWGKAAKAGHIRAQNGLGILYRDGLGLEKNVEEAISWFLKSADNGYAYGMYNLATVYIDRGGSRQAGVDAYKWLYLSTALNFDEKANYQLYILGNKLNELDIKKAKKIAQLWFDSFFFSQATLRNEGN